MSWGERVKAISNVLRWRPANKLAQSPLRQVPATPIDEDIGIRASSEKSNSPPSFHGTSLNSQNRETVGSHPPKFQSNWLKWPVARSSRTFRVYVVEPSEYHPEMHADIFNAALTSLITPECTHIDSFVEGSGFEAVEHFDLVTFPEAFLPADDLLMVLKAISSFDSIGCVHVGLRPSGSGHHLFITEKIMEFIESLSSISNLDTDDLVPFSKWLKNQPKGKFFNVGCLFTIDANQKLRICLHPKIVRSKFESSPLQECHMVEADLLTLVTLLPEDKTLLSATIQPLICSDVLLLDTDRPYCRPMEAVTNDAKCFGNAPPDHVDIVSVATCTPQPEPIKAKGVKSRQWHQKFRESFIRAASDDALARHHNSVFVLSNFGKFPPTLSPGGLSGAFIPIPLRHPKYPDFVIISSWGRPKRSPDSDNSWSQAGEVGDSDDGWSSLGYVASLDSMQVESSVCASMLGFTIHRFPRDVSHWKAAEGLIDFQLRTANFDFYDNDLIFRK